MKRLAQVCALFVILPFLLGASTVVKPGGSGSGWLTQTDCSGVITNGQGCYDSDDHSFCVGNGSSCATVTGATGPQGPQGPAGATGATGATGAQGPPGE